MIIRRMLSWDHLSTKEHVVFMGYYNTTQYWAEIKHCYVEFAQLADILDAILNPGDCPIHRNWRDGVLHIRVSGKLLIFHPGVIQVEEQYIHVCKLVAVDLEIAPFFNYACLKDDRMFSFDDIYKAVIQGIQRGYTAGMNRKLIIDGLGPEEFAWKYMEDLKGM